MPAEQIPQGLPAATAECNARLAEFRRRADRAGVPHYWVVAPENVRYLCGFTGDDSTLVVTPSQAVLVTDSRYAEQAQHEAAVDEVLSRHTPMAAAVGSLCRRLGVGRLAVTEANLTHADYMGVGQSAPTLEITGLKQGIAESMRERKSPREVEAIRASMRLAEDAFAATLACIEPGRSERWLAARLEYEMRVRGAEAAAFDTICAVDERASLPHARPGETRVREEGSVLLDWGARLSGYCSDLTRTVCVGRIPDVLGGLVEVVLSAQDAVLESLKPGRSCGDADAAGRAVIAKAGRGRCFGHGMGHGVGLVVHEAPRLGPRSTATLLPGMVVTVEPGVYLPGEAGVRIEELVLITRDGHEVLTSLPRTPEATGRAGAPAAG